MIEMLRFSPWDAAAAAPPLGAHSLHLWRIQAGPAGADPAALWPLLSPAEHARARRMVTQTLQDRYARVHGYLRLILSLYTREMPERIVFTTSGQGKPSLLQPPGAPPHRLRFNLTGSYDLALVAITRDRPVGVDCELIRPRQDFLGIARRMFSQQVADALEGTPEPNRLGAFYAAWTALEAQVKADGCGLFRPRGRGATRLTTAHFVPESGYVAAVARDQLPPPRLWGAYEVTATGL